MKFIIPNYPLSDSFAENVVTTLQSMGHEVYCPKPKVQVINHKFIHLMEGFYDKIRPLTFSAQEKWILETLKSVTKFDVFIALTQTIKEEILIELKNRGIVTIAWWGDTPANMRREGLLNFGWDYIYIKDKYAALSLIHI
jgi:hypothetical protein